MNKVVILVIVALTIQLFGYQQQEHFQITFFDIGQGDSILFKTHDNKNVLIDTGKNSSLMTQLDNVTYPRKVIDLLIITHFDSDHYGELLDLLNYYQVKKLILPVDNKESRTIDSLKLKLIELGTLVLTPTAGAKIDLGNDSSIEFIWPKSLNQFYSLTSNDASLSFVLKVGHFKALFAGDLSSKYEDLLVEDIGDVDLLKVSHHGSRYSTSYEFISKIKPEISVISVGENNSYGHPAEIVTKNLESYGPNTVLDTAKSGQITLQVFASSYMVFVSKPESLSKKLYIPVGVFSEKHPNMLTF